MTKSDLDMLRYILGKDYGLLIVEQEEKREENRFGESISYNYFFSGKQRIPTSFSLWRCIWDLQKQGRAIAIDNNDYMHRIYFFDLGSLS